MKFFPLVSLIFLLCNLIGVENANILAIFPMIQKSHFMMFKRLLEELTRRGHTIDVLGGIPPPQKESVPGITYIDIPDLPVPDIPHFTINDLRSFTVNSALQFMFKIGANPLCRDVFKSDVVKNLRDSKKKYDLLFIEIFLCDCFFGFAHTFKVPVISLMSSTDLPWGGYRIGNPDNPSYIPVYFQGLRPHESLYDRFWNTVAYLQTKIGHRWYIQEQNEMSKKFFGQDMPDLNDIIANISVLFTNSHFSLNSARPAVPNFIEVGGLHIDSPKSVDKEVHDFIGKDQFIYFSLGSIADSETFEKEILQNIMHTFSELSYKVVWKANETEMVKIVKIPPNVLVKPWLSQLPILCHPNTVLFITHSGLLGTQEAVHCGVPMLCMPLFADQYQNCQNMVDRKVAKSFRVENLKKEEFGKVLKELIQEPSYKENAKVLSAQFKDRESSPLETAVYWVEYVLRHQGAPQLRSLSNSLKWYQYHLVDVICILILLCLLSLISIVMILRLILNHFSKTKNESGRKKKD